MMEHPRSDQPSDAPKETAADIRQRPVSWPWRIGTAIVALGAGFTTTALRIRERHYDEIKKTEGFRELRDARGAPGTVGITQQLEHLEGGAHAQYDRIAREASSWSWKPSEWAKRFEQAISERHTVQRAYSKAVQAEMFKRYGILSKGLGGLTIGTWQRFRWLGSNNQKSALQLGFLTTIATVGVGLLLRENSWLWNKVNELRADIAQQAEDRLQETHHVLQHGSMQHMGMTRQTGNLTPASKIDTKELAREPKGLASASHAAATPGLL